MTTIVDDRTPEQKVSHPHLIIGTDRFMSGWGAAAGGASYAAWACTESERNDCYWRIAKRGDMTRVRETYGSYRPGRNCAHLHIYVYNQ
jgi:hypothetical protein